MDIFTPSPALVHEGARLPFITHTCHHHYAQLRSLDSPGLLPFVDCPVYNCLLPHLFPVSALMSLFCPLSRRCSCPVSHPLFIMCSPCTCFLSPASILTSTGVRVCMRCVCELVFVFCVCEWVSESLFLITGVGSSTVWWAGDGSCFSVSQSQLWWICTVSVF
jgi:hypothetical protein